MSTCAVQIEGILQMESQKLTYVSRPPLQDGVAFYIGLTRAYRVVLISEEPDDAKVVWWLRSQGISDFGGILFPPPTWSLLVPADRVSRQIKALRADSQEVGLVAVSDPSVAARLMHDGVPTALYSHPRFTRPEHRPEGFKGIRPWADIEAEVDEQKRLSMIERPDTAEVVG